MCLVLPKVFYVTCIRVRGFYLVSVPNQMTLVILLKTGGFLEVDHPDGEILLNLAPLTKVSLKL